MSESTTILVIIVATVLMFIWGRLPVMLVALAACVSLYLTGLLSLDQTFAGFGNPLIIFIAGLFVVAVALEKTGITAYVSQWLARKVGDSPVKLSIYTVVIVALLSPLISTSGAVTALVPVVTLLALKIGQAPSKFLMPLAFGSAAGSKLALTGTPKNVLVSDASYYAGYGGFGFFEFALVGIPLLIGTVLIVALLGRRLLPERHPASLPVDFGQHARTLVSQYGLDKSGERFAVAKGSLLVGKGRDEAASVLESAVTLLSVTSGASGRPLTHGRVSTGDIFVLAGEPAAIRDATLAAGLIPENAARTDVADTLFNRNSGLAEVVVPPRSPLIGSLVSPGMVTESGDLVFVAVQRQGEDLTPVSHSEEPGSAGILLRAGDHLLLQGTWDALDRHLKGAEVLVVDSPDAVRRQAVPLGEGSTLMFAIVAVMVIVLATGILQPSVGVLLAAMAIIGFGVLTVEQAYRAIDWNTVVLVAAMMPLSTAMQQSGTAEMLAELLVRVIGDAGPIALLAGLFLFTCILGQVISNTATAMILIPIAISSAMELNVSAQPVLMSLNVGATAAFLTPVATASNLIVMGPAGYKFGDYWKLGLCLMVLYFVVAVLWVPLIWPL